MATALLVLHLMIASALVGVVLLQRSEGGALGIGGGGGGGFLTGRGTANLLTRTTAALAAAFFATSILLTLLAQHSAPTRSIFDNAPASTAPAGGTTAPAAGGTAAPAPAGQAPAGARGGILDKLQSPSVPQNR
jgi:preprotein translocase subunit SecG